MGESTQPDRDRPDKPSEYTYRDYQQEVETSAEVAVDALEEYPNDFDNQHEAVQYAIEGDTRYLNYGHMLMTVLLSDQTPDEPDYCDPWHAYVSDPERWASAVQSMARVCYYSDVYERATRLLSEREHPDHETTDPDDCPTCLVEQLEG